MYQFLRMFRWRMSLFGSSASTDIDMQISDSWAIECEPRGGQAHRARPHGLVAVWPA